MGRGYCIANGIFFLQSFFCSSRGLTRNEASERAVGRRIVSRMDTETAGGQAMKPALLVGDTKWGLFLGYQGGGKGRTGTGLFVYVSDRGGASAGCSHNGLAVGLAAGAGWIGWLAYLGIIRASLCVLTRLSVCGGVRHQPVLRHSFCLWNSPCCLLYVESYDLYSLYNAA